MLVVGVIAIIASIFLSPIVYNEYKYRKCVALTSEFAQNSQMVKEVGKAMDFEGMLKLKCYGVAYGDN